MSPSISRTELLRKYNVPGPRYTSYPTVPFWSETPSQEQWLSALAAELKNAREKNLGAAIYVHIPFCESLCTYCGCNTRITRNHGVGLPYVDTVLAEWKLYAEKLGFSKAEPLLLKELHLGGGTPTFLNSNELTRLVDGILEFCRVENHSASNESASEFSIEVDPRVTTKDQLQALAVRGFKRISLGVQDFDPKVQDIVHRVQSVEQVRKITEEARDLGFTSVNYDLIYGLPFQTLESIQATISAVRELKPDRLAFYAYAHVPWIKASQRRFSEKDLPAGEEKRKLYELGRTLLEDAGYVEIGMDHFALKTDDLFVASQTGRLHRNFMGYTARLVTPQFGLGVSAIGDAWSVFSQNEKILEKYQERIGKGELPILRGHVLNKEDLVIRQHVLKLMTALRTSWEELSEQTEHLEKVPTLLREAADDGLVEISNRSVRVTPDGIACLRNICMAFDARLQRQMQRERNNQGTEGPVSGQSPGKKTVFSQTI